MLCTGCPSNRISAPYPKLLQREYEDMPLKTFYRYVLLHVPPAGTAGASAESTGSAAVALPAPPAAEFSGLPPNKVLTLGMDEPEPW